MIQLGQDARGLWAWMLYSRDGGTILNSGQGYTSLRAAMDGAAAAYTDRQVDARFDAIAGRFDG